MNALSYSPFLYIFCVYLCYHMTNEHGIEPKYHVCNKIKLVARPCHPPVCAILFRVCGGPLVCEGELGRVKFFLRSKNSLRKKV